MEQLLTSKQLSELLQVNLSTVYKWTHMGFIPHVKLGKSIRFNKQDVERWLSERQRKGRLKMRY